MKFFISTSLESYSCGYTKKYSKINHAITVFKKIKSTKDIGIYLHFFSKMWGEEIAPIILKHLPVTHGYILDIDIILFSGILKHYDISSSLIIC